jgi:hypothetical protein
MISSPPLWRYAFSDPPVDRDREVREQIEPLRRRLADYETLLTRLRFEGGKVRDLKTLTELMVAPIPFPTHDPTADPVCLANVRRTRSALAHLDWGLKLEVRTGPHGFPHHYLFRARSDYFGRHTVILEDLHRATAFDEEDPAQERFFPVNGPSGLVRLLRLSGLRPAAARLAGTHRRQAQPEGTDFPAASDASGAVPGRSGDVPVEIVRPHWADGPLEIDQLLLLAGRHVLRHAWHEDQRLALAVARLLGLPAFRELVEVLYLLLGADLSRLRSACMDPTLGPALEELAETGGGNLFLRRVLVEVGQTPPPLLQNLRTWAETAYSKLAAEFTALMQTQHGFEGFPGRQPLYRMLLAHYRRIDALRPYVTPALADAGARVERLAAEVSS